MNQTHAIKPIKRNQTVNRAVQDEIKSYIIANSLKPSDPLPTETELAHLLDVSRNSVREAVKSLEALGIIESRVGSGLFVRDFTFDSILDNLPYGMMFALKQLKDILEVRFHLEYGMMARVCEQVTPEQLSQLQTILDRMHKQAELGIYSAEDDRNFHRALYGNLNNEILVKVLDIFWQVFRRAQEQANIPDPRDLMDTYSRHAEILDGLRNRELQTMTEAMKRHYEGIEARVRHLEQTHDPKESAS